MFKFQIILTLVLICLAYRPIDAEVEDWDYSQRGPATWSSKYPNCGGRTQSPININILRSVLATRFEPLNFVNYSQQTNWTVQIYSTTVHFDKISNQPAASINGGDLSGAYNLVGIHFHWGANDLVGSEHSIDNVFFPLELHLVHKTANLSIAVLSILFEASTIDNSNLTPIITLLKNKNLLNSTLEMAFDVSKLLPTSKHFYRYTGSLTTPPCTEGVIWSVFTSKLAVSVKQMETFRNLGIKQNFRPSQSLNSRSINYVIPSLF